MAADVVFPQPVERGCGHRKAGGAYWELGLGEGGMPVEFFLLDPPIKLGDLHVPARGVLVIERDGVTHLVDRVGREYYPNVADFVEEVRRFGLSRRLPPNIPFAKITPASQLFLVHDRAWVNNVQPYDSWRCPKNRAAHAVIRQPEMCAGVWWEDVEGGLRFAGRAVLRTMPSFEYEARCRPEGHTPHYEPAFFMAVPCGRIAVVRGNNHEATAAKARTAMVRVDEVDQ